MDIQHLSFGYRRTSTLPRRTFIVNVSALYIGNTSRHHLTFDVTAPDGLAAEGIVRRLMWDRDAVITTWTMDMVREVIQPRWSDDTMTVRIPEGFCPPQFVR